MKREYFDIFRNCELIDTRTKFNACNRAVEADIREIAHGEEQTYSLVSSATERDERKMAVHGCRVWRGDKSQTDVVYTIVKRIN